MSFEQVVSDGMQHHNGDMFAFNMRLVAKYIGDGQSGNIYRKLRGPKGGFTKDIDYKVTEDVVQGSVITTHMINGPTLWRLVEESSKPASDKQVLRDVLLKYNVPKSLNVVDVEEELVDEDSLFDEEAHEQPPVTRHQHVRVPTGTSRVKTDIRVVPTEALPQSKRAFCQEETEADRFLKHAKVDLTKVQIELTKSQVESIQADEVRRTNEETRKVAIFDLQYKETVVNLLLKLQTCHDTQKDRDPDVSNQLEGVCTAIKQALPCYSASMVTSCAHGRLQTGGYVDPQSEGHTLKDETKFLYWGKDCAGLFSTSTAVSKK